ncbi:MAG TPA: BatA and WFA domain-containing protein [Candidatus Ozemobacteraceae bacterium]|nr:BatA and WFA domain-containing protein [Candidatus Ozemobacteraceae bacterium]
MMPFFMSPAALWGLLTISVLAAVYLFRRQARDVKVSSLMFFGRRQTPAEGGRKLTVPQAPFILLVEMAILILLVLAAANPRAITGEKLIPVILILDDSLSMGVNAPDSPRSAALRYIERVVFAAPSTRITMIRAGAQPEVIGRHDMTPAEASSMLAEWQCNSAGADLFKALRYVTESFTPDISVLVFTDHPPEKSPEGRMQWLSFGKPLSNVAITAVSRYSLGGADRCFVEFTSFAAESCRLEAEILLPDQKRLIESIDTMLKPGETRRVRFVIKDTAQAVQARIKNDPVSFDNTAWLMPIRRTPLTVAVDIGSKPLLQNVIRAIEASGLATVAGSSSQLLFTTRQTVPVDDSLWQFVFNVASQPAAFSGTVSLDKGHPLTAGLPPVRAAWAVDTSQKAEGQILMSAGNVPLLEVKGRPEQNLTAIFNYVPEYSDLHKSALWPALFYNLLAWRQQFSPGPSAFNFRSGSDIAVSLPPEVDRIEMLSEDGRPVAEAAGWRRQAVFSSPTPGLYRIKAGADSWQIAVNLCSAKESDLRTAANNGLPELPLPAETMLNFADVRWWFIVPALLLLILHQFLTTRRRSADAAF